MSFFDIFKKAAPTIIEAHSSVQSKDVIFKDQDNFGYYAYKAEDLLATKELKPFVDKISVALGGKIDLFNKYLLPSINQLALFCQKIPASESIFGKPLSSSGHHISEGGLLLHSLETMYFSLNDSRLAFFNKGVNPSERDKHLTAARIACGLIGLLHDVGKLNDVIIVTYVKEGNIKKEVQWAPIESIPEFLARAHNIPMEQVFQDGHNAHAPKYFIKAWRKGRSDKHEIIGPFLIRAFLSKATLRLFSTNHELLENLMTAVDWNVLSSDFTMSRKNILYEISNAADRTSSERDKKNLNLGELSELDADRNAKVFISRALQQLTATGDVAVNKEQNCYFYSHSYNPDSEDPEFFMLCRFDSESFGTICQVLSKAKEIGNKYDVLQGHKVNLETIHRLFEINDLIIKSHNEDGLFNVKTGKNEFKAICFKDWKDVINPNGALYFAQKDFLSKAQLNFTDGIVPELNEGSSQPSGKIDRDLSSDFKDQLPKTKTKPKQEKKDENQKTAPAQEQVVKASEKEKYSENVSREEVRAPEDEQSRVVGSQEEVPEQESVVAPVFNDTNEPNKEITQNEDVSQAAIKHAVLDGGTTLAEHLQDKKAKTAKEVKAPSADELALDEDLPDLNSGFNLDFIKQMASGNVNADALTKTEPKPKKKSKKPQQKINPSNPTENQIQNYDKALYDYQEKEVELKEELKEHAVDLDNVHLSQKIDFNIYNDPEKPYFCGLDLHTVKQIEDICSKIESPRVQRNLSLEICNRLKGKFTKIDFITPDGDFAYAAFIWDDSVKKNNTAVREMQEFRDAGLFTLNNNEVVDQNAEIYYYKHIQMIPEITQLFIEANIKPIRVHCLSHPYEKIEGKPPTSQVMIEYFKYQLISLDIADELFGCKATGFAHKKHGRQISFKALEECFKHFEATGFTRASKVMSITKQITPPYMVKKGDTIIVAYNKEDLDGNFEDITI